MAATASLAPSSCSGDESVLWGGATVLHQTEVGLSCQHKDTPSNRQQEAPSLTFLISLEQQKHT